MRPKAKEIADVVEDVKIRSEVVNNTAHRPAHSLYHSSIDSWLKSKNQHENDTWILQSTGHSSQETFPKEMLRVQRKFSKKLKGNEKHTLSHLKKDLKGYTMDYCAIGDFQHRTQERTRREIN